MRNRLSGKVVGFFLAFILLCSCAFPPFVHAQRVSLSITPPLTEIKIKPGASLIIAFTISNLGDPVVLSSYVRTFRPDGYYGGLIVKDELEGPIRFNLENSNMKLGDSFYLTSNEGQQLLLKIRVPAGTPEGDYYYTFLGETSTEGSLKPDSNSSQAQAVIGSNILITVTESGKIDIKGRVERFLVHPTYSLSLLGSKYNIFESTDPIPVRLYISNVGANLIKPEGKILLTGNFGEKAEYAVLSENILSQSTRLIHATPSALMQKKDSLILKGFFVGKYTLSTSVNFGEGMENITATTTFYGIPFKLIGATLIALIVGITIIKKYSKEEEE